MSDSVQIVTLIVGCISTVFTAWISLQIAKVKSQQGEIKSTLNAQDAVQAGSERKIDDLHNVVRARMDAYNEELRNTAREVQATAEAKAAALKIADLEKEMALVKQRDADVPVVRLTVDPNPPNLPSQE
jgi:hypothetical protein